MADRGFFNAPPESPELAALRQQYQAQRRGLRWGSWLTLGCWVFLILFVLQYIYFLDGWLHAWLHVRVSSLGLTATPLRRSEFILYLAWGSCYLTGLLGAYFLYRLHRTRKKFYQLSQRSPQITYVSTPMGLADQPADQDALGFEMLAQAISGLLNHPATQAPYSLVLSGGWGSGKSSLMAQVRRTLTKAGPHAFQSLWFNVWHFQSEQHLLATFLSSILARCEEMPGFYRRLWWQRLLSQGFWEALRTAFVLALLLPVVGGFLYTLLPHAGPQGGSSAPLAVLFGSGFGQANHTAWLALAATWTGAAWSLLKAWQERANLLAGLVPMERFRLEAARADAGFRRKYQQEFRQLMRATPRGTRFLIFIDDVDRIPGSRVLELLESINFISDTASQSEQPRDAEAKLYFVLGMYVQEVARTLGEALNGKGSLKEEEATRHAARYLAKLVDLVVPLPGLQNCTPAQLNRLLFGSEVAEPAPAASTASTALDAYAEETPA